MSFRDNPQRFSQEADYEQIKELFEQAGAQARISSIHVNGWYGRFDKLSTSRLWAKEQLGIDLDAEREKFVQAGSGQHGRMPYFQIPDGVLADDDELAAWAAEAIRRSKE